jgi:DNA-binding Lrp family transcriptional regulator
LVLISTTAKEAKTALQKLRDAKTIRSAEAITGPYDIVAVVEAEDVDALGRLVTQEIHSIEGVERTLSCIVMKL